MNKERNILIVLSGPSGVGKGTIAKILNERDEKMSLSISCTTRQPREGELNGREYFFVEKALPFLLVLNMLILLYLFHLFLLYILPSDGEECKKFFRNFTPYICFLEYNHRSSAKIGL